MSGPSLLLSNASAGYGRRPVIRDLSLAPLAAGTLTALVGPNAAGKSTLLKALAGLLPLTGSLTLGPLDLTALSREERAAHLGFMPQALPPGVALTVIETVIGALRAAPLRAPLDGKAAQARAARMLDRLGITALALEPLDRLSGGQRQLASLAQAVVREPRVLLLDEPTSALDLRHQAVVMGFLKQLAQEGRVVVAVLHDLSLAARYADQMVVLDQGALSAQGRPAEALTPDLLARVYGVNARVEACSRGSVQILVDGPLPDETGACADQPAPQADRTRLFKSES